MISYNPLLCLDFYKTAHAGQYPATLTKMVSYYTPRISGLTLSGGDPMYSASKITPFIKALRQTNKNVTVWIYSGFTYEEILENSEMLELLSECDVLVDGRFVLEQRDMTLSYKGSRNQRIIDVQQSLQCENIVLWESTYAE